jgi:SAM-dependent methyltransferase
VVAVDASDAVEATQDKVSEFSNIHVVQADIHNLPFRKGIEAQIDFIFSIGVLHHLVEPQKGFEALVNHLKNDGTIFAWVYGRENNKWLIRVINPVRTFLTSRLPRQVLYILS